MLSEFYAPKPFHREENSRLQWGVTGEFCQTYKEEMVPILRVLQKIEKSFCPFLTPGRQGTKGPRRRSALQAACPLQDWKHKPVSSEAIAGRLWTQGQLPVSNPSPCGFWDAGALGINTGQLGICSYGFVIKTAWGWRGHSSSNGCTRLPLA